MSSPLISRIRRSAVGMLNMHRRLDELAMNQGRMLVEMQRARPGDRALIDHEFKVFSQWGEDGIIQFLTRHLNLSEHTFIEFGVEDFHESNCRFLMQKDHWRGFVIDGSDENIHRLKAASFYWQSQLQAVASFVTRENIETLLEQSGFGRSVGILSVDLDGVDYHVLEALGSWRASVIIVEYNDAFGWQRPISVPYDPAFVRAQKHFSNQYWGANLPAFDHLLRPRGYALVGTNSVGSNAFFVRCELLNEQVKEVPLTSCIRQAVFRDSRDGRGALSFLSGDERTRAMADMPALDVATGQTLLVGELLV